MLPTAGLSADQVTSRLKRFIDNGFLRRTIAAKGVPPYEIIRFVEWDHNSRVCRILLAGEEPNGRTTICRNVISVQYNDNVCGPLIIEKFPFIIAVKCLLTTESDFDVQCENLGARIDYPDNWDTPTAWLEAMSHYADRNPNIESVFKNTIVTEANSPTLNLKDSPPMTTPQFFHLYAIVFHVDSNTRVMTCENKLLQGKNEIMSNQNELPSCLEIVSIGDGKYGILCGDPYFYHDDRYKVVTFSE